MAFSSKTSVKNLPNHLEKIKIETRERRRNIIFLIFGFLKDNLFHETAETLIKETQLDFDNFQLCDNMELDIILQEYHSYYYTKFQKYPKIVRKLTESEFKTRSKTNIQKKCPNVNKTITEQTPEISQNEDFQFEIISLDDPKFKVNGSENVENTTTSQIPSNSELMIEDTEMRWENCLGLEKAVELLKESTIYPHQYPELFKDLTTWRGVLLYGPPGTGKTLLAKALAHEAHSTFFNVTSSFLISKWRGESEKILKNLFSMAKLHAPSTIFFDEVDGLLSSDNQHEASKRLRSELLIQLDGISALDNEIFVLASTNAPWNLDDALLRRFDKRIFIGMPSKETRVRILMENLKTLITSFTKEQLEEFNDLSEGYSGSDLKNVAKEVKMTLTREQIKIFKLKGNHVSRNRMITFQDIKTALKQVKPSNMTSCKKYYQWQNDNGAL